MQVNAIPVAGPYSTNPVYLPSQNSYIGSAQPWCFMASTATDLFVKVGFVLYTPVMIAQIVIGCCGFFGAYHKKKYLLALYLVYQLGCFCMGFQVIIGIHNSSDDKFVEIDIKYWYIYISLYLASSAVMILLTCSFVSKMTQSSIEQPLVPD